MPNPLVKESFDRCEATGDFAQTFYDIFLNASPEIAPLFANTNFDKQRRLLRGTVYILVTRTLDDPTARSTLEKIALSHNRDNLNIKPHLYDLWLDAVCQTVQQLDIQFTPDLEHAWREQLQHGIQFITSRY